jgi:hypothetical protein
VWAGDNIPATSNKETSTSANCVTMRKEGRKKEKKSIIGVNQA